MPSTSPVVRRTTAHLLTDLHRQQVSHAHPTQPVVHTLHPMRPYDEQLAHEQSAG